MSAKDKAEELVKKFRLNVLDYEGSGLNLYKAKQCALIAVDEVLNAIEYLDYESTYFWQQVKTEIGNI